jgi:hypothetical protein
MNKYTIPRLGIFLGIPDDWTVIDNSLIEMFCNVNGGKEVTSSSLHSSVRVLTKHFTYYSYRLLRDKSRPDVAIISDSEEEMVRKLGLEVITLSDHDIWGLGELVSYWRSTATGEVLLYVKFDNNQSVLSLKGTVLMSPNGEACP